MEKISLFDLQTQDPVPLPKSPVLFIFISLNDILSLKEISKDCQLCTFTTIGVHIGPDSKKIQLWKSKETGIIPIFFGGSTLAQYSELKITELPAFLLFNNKVLQSGPLTLFPKPFIQSILSRYPEFKPLSLFPQTLNPSQEKALEQEVKIYQLEQKTSETSKEIEELKAQFKEKDRFISEILEKIRAFENSRKLQHSSTGRNSEGEDYWTTSNIEEVTPQSVREPVIEQFETSPKNSQVKEPSKSPVNKKAASPVKKKK